MQMRWNSAVEAALRKLVADEAGDIVVRLSQTGEIDDASPTLQRLGCDLPAMLLKPHIADLAQRDHQASVRQFVDHALETCSPCGRIEFPIPLSRCAAGLADAREAKLHWYSLSLCPIAQTAGRPAGAWGLLRSIDRLHALETELNVSATIDSLTGLDNHRAFAAHLDRFAASGSQCAIALCQLENCRALQSRYGRPATEDVVWAFARFLQNFAGRDFILARLEGERFGVLLPRFVPDRAAEWARDAAAALDGLSGVGAPRWLQLGVRIGIADVRARPEDAMQDAEIALVMARAAGGVRRFCADYQDYLNGRRFGGRSTWR